MARLKDKYRSEVIPALKEHFGYKNVMEIPKLEKIVINMGLGDCKDNSKALELAVTELATISGQKPLVTKAKKSIAFPTRPSTAVETTRWASASS